jgi:hypothetical protein
MQIIFVSRRGQVLQEIGAVQTVGIAKADDLTEIKAVVRAIMGVPVTMPAALGEKHTDRS